MRNSLELFTFYIRPIKFFIFNRLPFVLSITHIDVFSNSLRFYTMEENYICEENLTEITEGKAKIFQPKTVFYNPAQEFNRDISVLVLDTYLKHELWITGKKVHQNNYKLCEALSATGLRCIRYALELDHKDIIKTFVANDLSKDAVKIIRKNVLHNRCDNVIQVVNEDANFFLSKHREYQDRFLVIDIDPFGGAYPFLDSAVQSVAHGGLLMVTCTDVSILCGKSSESCYAKYGSLSLQIDACHEMALRIVLNTLCLSASKYGRYIHPLICLSVDFYVRLFVQVFIGAAEAHKNPSKNGMVYLCNGCASYSIQPLGTYKYIAPKYIFSRSKGPPVNTVCAHCGSTHSIGGPIWIDPIYDVTFLENLKANLKSATNKFSTFKRIEGMLQVVSEELVDIPLYYSVDSLSRKVHSTTPSAALFHSALINGGYRVSYSHANKSSTKTDAPNEYIWDILRSWAKKDNIDLNKLEDGVRKNILSKNPSKDISFELAENHEPLSKKMKMCRYPKNPSPFWGPKSKPKFKSSSKMCTKEASKDKELEN